MIVETLRKIEFVQMYVIFYLFETGTFVKNAAEKDLHFDICLLL